MASAVERDFLLENSWENGRSSPRPVASDLHVKPSCLALSNTSNFPRHLGCRSPAPDHRSLCATRTKLSAVGQTVHHGDFLATCRLFLTQKAPSSLCGVPKRCDPSPVGTLVGGGASVPITPISESIPSGTRCSHAKKLVAYSGRRTHNSIIRLILRASPPSSSAWLTMLLRVKVSLPCRAALSTSAYQNIRMDSRRHVTSSRARQKSSASSSTR
jgi:hypothetical protein